jgi:hypothetical protein
MDGVYPKWIYHKTKPAILVNSIEEHKAAGKGWKESPADFEQQTYREYQSEWESKEEKAAKDQPPQKEE